MGFWLRNWLKWSLYCQKSDLSRLAEIQRVVHVARCDPGVDLLALIAAAIRPGVQMVGVQPAESGEHRQYLFLVVAGQLLVERVSVDRLCQEFGDVAAQVCHHLPASHRRFPPKASALWNKAPRLSLVKTLQLDPELFAVAQDDPVVIGNPRRPHVGVEVVFLVEVDPLAVVGFPNHVPAAHGQVSPAGAAGGFENRAVVSGL